MLVLGVFRIKKKYKLVQYFLIFLISILFIPLISAVSDGVTYYDLSSVADQWGGNTPTAWEFTDSASYPSYGVSGSSSPNSSTFDGTNDYINTGFGSSATYTDFTFLAWVRADDFSPSSSQNYMNSWTTGTSSEWFALKGLNTDFVFAVDFGDSCYKQVTASSSSYTDDTDWVHVAGVLDSSNDVIKIYVNGVNIANTSTTGCTEAISPSSNFVIGQRADLTNAELYAGELDEIKFYNIALNTTSIKEIYDTGGGVVAVDNFSVFVSDFWNSTDINNVWVYVDSVNYTNATGNTIITNLLQNDTGTYNIQVGSNTHFTRTYTSQSVSSNLNAEVYGSDIKFRGIAVNGSVVPLNVTIETITKENDTSFYLDIDNNILAESESSGYYEINYTFNTSSRQNETLNITGFYTTKLNVSPRDILNNNTFNGSNITLIANDYSYNFTFGNVSDAIFNVTSGNNYTLIIENSDRVTYNESFVVSDLTNYTYYAYMYAYNSIWVYAFKQSDSSSIPNFNVTISNANNSYNEIGSLGVARFDGVVSGSYDVVVSAVGYASASYSVVMTDDSFQTLNTYLSGATDTFIFLVKDKSTDNIIEDALIVQKRFINGTLTTIESKYSDITGRVQFTYENGIEYTFVASKSGFSDKSFLLEILFDTYVLNLDPVEIDNPDIYIDDVQRFLRGYRFVNGSSYYAVDFISDLGSLEYYNVSVLLPNGSYVNVSGSSATGSFLNASFVMGSVTFGDFAVVSLCYKSTFNSGNMCVDFPFMFTEWSDTTGGLEAFRDDMGSRSDLEKVFWFCVIMISLSSLFAGAGLFAGDSFLFACLGGIIGAVLGIVFALVTWEVGGIIIFVLVLFALGKVVNDG